MLHPEVHRETEGLLLVHHEEEALERVWTLTEKLDALTARAIDWDRVVAVAEELHVTARSMRSIPNAADGPSRRPVQGRCGGSARHDGRESSASRLALRAPGPQLRIHARDHGERNMPCLRLRLSSIVLAALATGALVATSLGPPALAAAKPSIRAVSVTAREFVPVQAIVFGANRVVICVSRRCHVAIRQSQIGVWTTLGGGLNLRKGQTREAIVFAASATGEVSFLVRQVTVK